MNTATASRISSDNDTHVAIRSADLILNALDDYIPRSCLEAGRTRLIDLMLDGKFELTNAAMRKEYEAWKSTQLSTLNMREAP